MSFIFNELYIDAGTSVGSRSCVPEGKLLADAAVEFLLLKICFIQSFMRAQRKVSL